MSLSVSAKRLVDCKKTGMLICQFKRLFWLLCIYQSQDYSQFKNVNKLDIFMGKDDKCYKHAIMPMNAKVSMYKCCDPIYSAENFKLNDCHASHFTGGDKIKCPKDIKCNENLKISVKIEKSENATKMEMNIQGMGNDMITYIISGLLIIFIFILLIIFCIRRHQQRIKRQRYGGRVGGRPHHNR